MDLVSFAMLAYFRNGTDNFDFLYRFTIDANEWVLANVSEAKGGVSYKEYYSKKRDMSVVAIRGTNPKDVSDMFQDGLLWHGPALWNLAGQVSMI